MGKIGSGLRLFAVLVTVVALSACAVRYRDHGYVPRDEDLARITVGESTREDVARAVGRPSTTGLLTGGAWYYVGSRFRLYGPREPEEIDRQVVAISFDDRGVVENVERFGLEDGQIVALSRRVTDSNIKGVGILRQLLGNLGNVSAAQLVNE